MTVAPDSTPGPLLVGLVSPDVNGIFDATVKPISHPVQENYRHFAGGSSWYWV